jgi:thioredoxin 1
MRLLPGVLLGVLMCAQASPGAMPSAEGTNGYQDGTKPSPERTSPFDESANARSDIDAALSRAAAEKKDVLLEFGANWCRDCRVLAATMGAAPLSERIAARYVVVRIDVGNWDRNLDVVKAWGNPIAKGIPSIVVVGPDGSVLYTTKAGELAKARRMGAPALEKFFAAIPERGL